VLAIYKKMIVDILFYYCKQARAV